MCSGVGPSLRITCCHLASQPGWLLSLPSSQHDSPLPEAIAKGGICLEVGKAVTGQLDCCLLGRGVFHYDLNCTLRAYFLAEAWGCHPGPPLKPGCYPENQLFKRVRMNQTYIILCYVYHMYILYIFIYL
jgi:hypothetical protein